MGRKVFHADAWFDPLLVRNSWQSRRLMWMKAIIILFCFLLNLLFFSYVKNHYDVLFATNDDYRMRLIISGAYTGTPSTQAVFLGSIIAGILTNLYRANPTIEWYGLFFYASIYLFACICESLFLSQARSLKDFIVRLLCVIIFSEITLMNHLLMPQFTTIAAFWTGLSMTACLAFLDAQGFHRRLFWALLYLLSTFFAIQVRQKIFLLCLPMQVIFIVSDFLSRDVGFNRVWRRVLVNFTVAAAAGLVILVTLMTNFNPDQGYRFFKDFCGVRSSIYDYSGWASYKENKEFYDSIGFSEAAWNCLNARTFDINPAVDTAHLKKIKTYTEDLNKVPLNLKITESIGGGVNSLSDDQVIHEIEALVLILVLFFTLIRRLPRRYLSNFFLWGSFLYGFFCLIGLLLLGRIMPRIVQSIAIVLAAISMYIMGSMPSGPAETKKRDVYSLLNTTVKWFTIIVVSVAMVFSFRLWINDDNDFRIKTLKNRTDMLYTLEAYMEQRPNEFMFYHALNFIASTDYVFASPREKTMNIDSLGNWNVFSPNYYARNAQFGFTSALDGLINHGALYAELGQNLHAPITTTLAEYGKALEKIDTLYCADEIISVYHVVDKT